jgi:hypothetical protein
MLATICLGAELGSTSDRGDFCSTGKPVHDFQMDRPDTFRASNIGGLETPAGWKRGGNLATGYAITIASGVRAVSARVEPGTGTSNLALAYDPDHARAEMCVPNCTSPTTTTLCLNDPNDGAMEERVTVGSTVTWRSYIQADGKLVAERFSTGSTVTMNTFIDDPSSGDRIRKSQRGLPR